MNSFEDPSQEPGHETGGGKEFGLTPEQTEALRANTQEILSNRFLPRLYASYMQEPYGWLPDIWDYYRGNDENTRRLVTRLIREGTDNLMPSLYQKALRAEVPFFVHEVHEQVNVGDDDPNAEVMVVSYSLYTLEKLDPALNAFIPLSHTEFMEIIAIMDVDGRLVSAGPGGVGEGLAEDMGMEEEDFMRIADLCSRAVARQKAVGLTDENAGTKRHPDPESIRLNDIFGALEAIRNYAR